MAANGATTVRRAAERNRRQREHAKSLRERTNRRQFFKRLRAQIKINDARSLIAEQVKHSREHGLMAKAKCLRAAERSRTAAGRARARARERAKRNRSERR